MFTGATKIVKPEGQEADEFEQTVAQELFNLEVKLLLLLLVLGGPDADAIITPLLTTTFEARLPTGNTPVLRETSAAKVKL